MKPPVILVNMPWAMLRAPSLQLSTIKALLARHGIIASVLNLNLAWMKTLHEAGFSVADYIKVEAAAMAPGDWTFAIPPFRPASAAGVDDVAGYRDSIRGAYDDALFAALLRMRELVPGFVDGHVHLIGGGGEGGFVTRTPEVDIANLVRNGITTVAGLLAELEIGTSHTAVERNRQIVPKTAFAATSLEDGDQLEIVTLVGGG